MADSERNTELSAQAPVSTDPSRRGAWTLSGTAYEEERSTRLPHASLVLRFQSEDGERSPEYALEADADGRFTWTPDGEPPTGVAMLEARQERHLPSAVELTLDPAKTNPVLDIIVFGLDLEIAGHVRDSAGAPIAGAKLGRGPISGMAAADGSFQFWGRRNIGQYPIRCQATGYASTEIILETNHLESATGLVFVLTAGLTVEGIVTRSNGTPLEGVLVTTNDRQSAQPRSQADGSYVLDGIDPASGDLSIRASLEGYLTRSISMPEQLAGRASLDIELDPAPSIRGFVRSQGGDPIPEAHVQVGRRGDEATTDAGGSFELQSSRAGSVFLKTTAVGYAQDSRRLEIDPSQGSTLEVEVVLAAGRDLAGFVVDAEGQAIAGATVFPYLGIDRLGGEVRTADDGSFLLKSMPMGRLRLEISSRGHLRGYVPHPSFDDIGQRFTLLAAGTLAGTALDARTGQALDTFRVRFVEPDLRPGESASLDMDMDWLGEGATFTQTGGQWIYPDVELIPGQVIGVEIRADGYSPAVSRRATVRTTPSHDDLVLRLDPAVRLEGSVTLEASGAAVSGAAIRAFRPQSGVAEGLFAEYAPSNNTATGADGSFALAGVPTGQLLLQLAHPSFGTYVAEPITIPPGSASQTHHVVIPGTGRVDGVLLDAHGEARSGALIRLGPARRYGVDDSEDAETRSDAEGRFAFEGVIAGPHTLTHHLDLPEGRTWPHFVQGLHVGAGKTTEVTVRPLGSANLTAKLDTIAALPAQVRVRLNPPAGSPARQGPKVVGALAHAGRIQVAGMQPGAYVASGWFRDADTREVHEFDVSVQLSSGDNALELSLD